MEFKPVVASPGGGKSATKWSAGEEYLGYLLSTQMGGNSRYGTTKTYTFANARTDGTLTGDRTTLITSAGLEPFLVNVKLNQLVFIKCLGAQMGSKKVFFEVQASDAQMPAAS